MITTMPFFKFWCQKVLPLVYDDSISYYETLCKLTHWINEMLKDQKLMAEILEIHQNDIQELKKEMDFLNSEFEKVKNGDYVSLYIDALASWIDNNLQEMVSKIVTYVTFGLSDDGHFVAYIPRTWQFLSFDTDMDFNSPLYGHLIMGW